MKKESILLHKLCCDISKYEDFVLYGAGHVAEVLLDCLEERKYIPQYCVVTHLKNNYEKKRTIGVCSFEDKKLELKEKNILILIAVSDLYEKEIVELLKENNICNILLTSQYIEHDISKNNFEKIYRDKNYEWYKLKIKKWYSDKNGILLKEDFFCNNYKEENRILFVVENLSPRVIKIANSLKVCGQEVIILINNQVKGGAWEKFYKDLGDGYVEYGTVEELLFLLIKYQGEVVHIFANSGRLYTAYIIIMLQEYFGKVVFETYDIFSGFYINVDNYFIEVEKYCLENAKAICYREYSLECLKDKLNYCIKGKTLRFYDYCSENQNEINYHESDEELSICYVGGVVTEEEFSDCPFTGFMELADKCEENRCHLHIYPSHYDEKRYKQYIKKDNESLYFHFHKTLTYGELAREISQYDYGICPSRDDVWDKEYSGYNTKDKYIYSGTNKYFDYLDAGLPIISALPRKLIEDLEKEGVLINWTNGQYDFNYLKKYRNKMKDMVNHIRKKYKINKNINDLLDFYKVI